MTSLEQALLAFFGGEDIEPVGYDSFGAPLYAHQLPPEGVE